ncbi:MAG: hypothetical protein PVJ57_21860, partial [Phycisphaerae bacterium]
RYSRASAYSSAQRGRLGTNLDPESTPPFFIPPSTKFGYSSWFIGAGRFLSFFLVMAVGILTVWARQHPHF